MTDLSSSSDHNVHPSSYRDPSGFIFTYQGKVFRQVNPVYREDYEHLIHSGLYKELTETGLLIPHREAPEIPPPQLPAYRILEPEPADIITYPWEWSFSMLKDAALATLDITRLALGKNMILKDATPFNLQWYKGKLVFIDTLSFEIYTENSPWVAYRQFCENFLGPLLLMHYRKEPLHALSLAYPEGIPLQLVSRLLPRSSRFSPLVYLHVHLHAKWSRKNTGSADQKAELPRKKLITVLSSLHALVSRLKPPVGGTTWSGYYEEASMREDYLQAKENLVSHWVQDFKGVKTATDFGCNEGRFSFITARAGIHTLAIDADAAAVDRLYQKIKSNGFTHIAALIADFSYPSPAMGVNHEERASLAERIRGRDLGLCLALIHHLCLGKNIPFDKTALFFSRACNTLVIEFVPADDPKAQILLARKKNIYHWYTEEAFRDAFSRYFHTLQSQPIARSGRTLYLMQAKNSKP